MNAALSHVDPRLRIAAAVVLSVVVAMADRFDVLAIGLAAGVIAVTLAGNGWLATLRALVPMEIVLATVALLLPVTAPSPEAGLALGARVLLKGNAIVLLNVSLLGTLEPATLGHALHHLRLPEKLVHLLVFTVRYLDVLRAELVRMRRAMRVRGFRPRMDGHTYRAYGHLIGMLLVRSVDRAERIEAAMRCRGFHGRFYLLDHFHLHARCDVPFALAAVGLCAVMAFLEWGPSLG